MQKKIFTRMGDGERVSMSTDDVKEDIQAATQDAARRADIPELTQEEIEQLVEIMAEPSRAVSVNSGQEVVVTDDGCSMSFYSGQDGGSVGVPLSRLQAILTYERALAAIAGQPVLAIWNLARLVQAFGLGGTRCFLDELRDRPELR